MKLYSGPLSLFSAKVRIALAEKRLDYTLESVPFSPVRGYEPKHPFVLAHNPKAQVPVLSADDVTLYDSTVILEFLEDRHPEPALYPREPAARARCRLLEMEADEQHFAPVAVLIQERFYTGMRQQLGDDSRIAQAETGIRRGYGRLNERLTGVDYLCGSSLSVADISHALVVLFAVGLQVPVPAEFTNLHAWLQRLLARPSFMAELVVMSAALPAQTPAQAAPSDSVGAA